MKRTELTKVSTLAALILAVGCAALAQQQPKPPLPEHPRPDWERADWINLNGDWKFAFDQRDAGLGERWYAEPDERFNRKIRVPFGWGSPLSGVGDEADVGWYRRGIAVPESWKGRRVFVVFGAADHDATVWFAGRRVGEHLGGYTPFEAEVTDLIEWGKTQPLTVRVWDEPAEAAKNGWRLFGKQGYGNARGLWQTVYLEARPETYLERVRFTSDLVASSVSVAVTLGAPAKRSLVCRVRLADGSAQAEVPFAPGESEKASSLKLTKPRPWSPDDPYLYDTTVRLEPAEPSAAERTAQQRVAAELARLDDKARAAYSRYVSLEDPDVRHGFDRTAVDEVKTYFGFREIGTAHVAAVGGTYVTLNGKPTYLRMALDQGYHPEGWYVFPTDAAVRDDVALAKSLGLNGLRIHVKAETPRKLYWADRLGVLVMADVPCAWGPPEERGWAEHRSCYEEMVARDFNHPSVFSWVLFNETWGLLSDEADQPPNRQGRRQRLLPATQRRLAAEWRRAKGVDPTRLVEDNSACNQDHVLGDLNTWHGYLANWHWESNLRDTCDRDLFAGSGRNHIDGFVQTGAPLVNSECGAVWGYKGATGDIDWSWDYHLMMDAFRRHLKNSGFVFTELADVTNEWNGYVRFDRSTKETGLDELMPGMSVRDFHADAYLAVGEVPCATFEPGETLRAPVALSCVTDELKGRSLVLRARLRWWDARGELHAEAPVVGETFAGRGFGVWPLAAPALRLPDESACGSACFELWDGDRTAARNFTCFVVREKTPKGLRADACTANAWTQGHWSVLDGLKVCGAGRGAFEYAFDVPADAAGDWEFFAEVSTKRLNGKDRAKADNSTDGLAFMLGGGVFDRSRNPNAYPMTSADKWPGGVSVSVGGETLAYVELPDDPADHRGILSWQAQLRDQRLREAGSYGYPVRVRIPARFVKAAAGGKLAVRLAAKGEHGLAVYGENFGRFPSGPALRPALADPAYAAIESAVSCARGECERLSAGLTNGVSVLDCRSLVEVRGGTNIWTRAFQKALDEHEVVVIPAAEEPYYVDATLVVPSNRRIEAAGARIRLADGVGTVLLRNANVKDGTLGPIPSGARDDNITVVGGSWEDCQTARAGYGRSGTFHAYRRGEKGDFYGVSTLFLFENCNHVTVRGATFANCGGFAVQAGGGDALVFERIRFADCYADGLHLNGNLSRVHCRDVRGKVGDDLIALNAYDWHNSSIDFGPQQFLLCEDLELVLKDGKGYPAIRIQPAKYRFADGSVVDCSISDVIFRRVKGIRTFKMYLQTPQYVVGRNDREWADVGSGGNFYFERLDVDLAEPIDNFGPYASSDPLRGHFGAFELGANLSSVTIRDSDVTLHADRWPRTHLVTVGPKSAPYVTKRGNRMEIFDPYVSCTVGAVKIENVRFRGKVPTELVHAVEFKDVNGDGDSSGVGRIKRLEM